MFSKEEILIKSLLEFYSNPMYLKIFTTIVVDGGLISLRLLDFFSTTYSKENQIWIGSLDIHNDYKQYLKGYTKKLFDPFCRRERVLITCSDHCIFQRIDKVSMQKEHEPIELQYETTNEKSKKHERGIVTTVGQLNFFKWCFERNILNYIREHYEEIEMQMNRKHNPIKCTKKYPCIIKQTKIRIQFQIKSPSLAIDDTNINK